MCQWFILNGISKTFCFGFIRSFFLYVFVLFVLFLFFFAFVCIYYWLRDGEERLAPLAVDLRVSVKCSRCEKCVSGIR